MMTDHRLELDAFSIVVLGSFNPAIFHPLWFSFNNLIRTEEATKNVEIQVVHRNATIFTTEWFSLQVTGDRFAVETRDPSKSLLLRDLALGTFKTLEHTPLSSFGLNRISQFQVSTVERWHAFGHHFAPKESWNKIIKDPGLRVLAIEGKRDGCDGKMTVSIEPSAKVQPGILININEHHDLPVPEKAGSPGDRVALFLDGLQTSWEGFVAYSDRVSGHLFTESSKPTKKKRR